MINTRRQPGRYRRDSLSEFARKEPLDRDCCGVRGRLCGRTGDAPHFGLENAPMVGLAGR
jgi:hypothetical protein